jgi:hypothetical protein
MFSKEILSRTQALVRGKQRDMNVFIKREFDDSWNVSDTAH